MTMSVSGQASALGEALRALERVLDETRTQWDDNARQTFDRRYGDQIVSAGRQALSEMQRLAAELAHAAGILDSLR